MAKTQKKNKFKLKNYKKVFKIDKKLKQEAKAFDNQIKARVTHGHIPDLRLVKPCNYFYNNPWRRPEYVKLDFGEKFKLILDNIIHFSRKAKSGLEILEVGCGPGHMCLELARNKFNVVGLDLSNKCIRVAQRFANTDPWKKKRGNLRYISGDFFTHPDLKPKKFDVILFVGALHHFSDQRSVMVRTRKLLKSGGLVIAIEPVRDRIEKGNAIFALLLSTLLSIEGKYYKTFQISTDLKKIKNKVDKFYKKLRYISLKGKKIQSVNDNESGYAQMHPALVKAFKPMHFEWRYAFFHDFIGGLRFSRKKNILIAKFLKHIDKLLVETGTLPAASFFFVGRKLFH